MTGNLFREAQQGNRGAVGLLLNRHKNELRLLAARELEQHCSKSLLLGPLVERTLRTAEHDFASFNGASDDEWLEWLTAILKRNIGEEVVRQGKRFQAALAALPLVQGQVVRLRQFQGWDLARIAAHLGLDEVVAAGLLRCGVHRLREVFESENVF